MWTLATGCGSVSGDLFWPPAPLFSVPLEIDGVPVGTAIIDTGGGYELMLRETVDLAVVGMAEVLAFGGKESVVVTEGFDYSAGGFTATADFALAGASICDCNGLGYHFFRKTGVVLGLDFAAPAALFEATVPPGGVTIRFEPPPPALESFDSAFVQVEVRAGGASRTVPALLDTSSSITVMRRGLIGSASILTPDQVDVTITQARLGTVAVRTRLFDTVGLPDVILGTDVMRTWGERWYFSFVPGAGTVTVFLRDDAS